MNNGTDSETQSIPITFGSLFAGIGGIDLGFERAGLTCRWQVEIDEYARKVLAKHWPEVKKHDDIRTWPTADTERVDIICGGFPCQDISYAGHGAGLEGSRSGLFFEAVRVVRQLQPRVVVLENVAALLARGLDRVLGTLAEIGFDAEWHCIPAAAVGAPHIRDRVFVIGHRDPNTDSDGRQTRRGDAESETQSKVNGRRDAQRLRCAVPNAKGIGREALREDCNAGSCSTREKRQSQSPRICSASHADCHRRSQVECQDRGTETQTRFVRPLVQQGSRGWRADWWKAEPDVGRVAHGIPSRVDRLRGLGNAVVPQVAELIGRNIYSQIMEVEQ